jgi:predicted O-linked N-acetylglucosamine transferase (SPINDLY family)
MTKQSIEQILLNAVAHVRAGETEQAQALCENALALLAQQMPLPSPPQPQSVGEPPAENARHEVAPMAVPRLPKEKQVALINLYNQGELALVVEQAEALTQQFPQAAVLWNLLGAANAGLGHFQQAERAFREACRVQPDDADGHNNLGNVLQAQNKLDEAIAEYQRSIEIKPNNARVHNNLGSALRSQNRLDEALTAFRLSIKIDDKNFDAHYNIANYLLFNDKAEDAVTAYQRALKIKADHAGAHYNLGIALSNQNKFDDAIAAFRRAVEIKPNHAGALNNLGVALQKQKKLDEAIAAYQRAIEIGPECAGTYNNLGNALREARRLNDSIAAYQRAVDLNPRNKESKAQILHTMRQICDWREFEAANNKNIDIGITGPAVPPFAILSIEDNPQRQMLRSKNWSVKKYDKTPILLLPNECEQISRLRIGYFSSDFYDHATLHLMAGLVRNHDKSNFEIFFFNYGRRPLGQLGNFTKNIADYYYDITEYSDDDVVNLARSHKLHVAIDLKGHTAESRSHLFQFRLAPIQINYLGYPGSMGAHFIDYIIADATIIPKPQRPFYTENVIYMPNSYQPNDDIRGISLTSTARADFGLPEDAFVFCCFNNNYKISPREFDIWMRLLANINGSVLWLLRANQWAEANLCREAQMRGIDPSRLVFAEKLPHADHLARHKHADLFIDTFNYNAHTTASDALWAGLPVVTMLGKQFAARVAGSLLNAIGLQELITHSEQEYESLILELARDRQKLQALKCKLSSNRLTQTLFDTKRYTRNFENGLRMVVDHYRQGMAPQDLFIQDEID